jgi:hypothetical protein
MSIIDGPVCAADLTWWKIDDFMVAPPGLNDSPGWIAEGAGPVYFIEPGRNRYGCPGGETTSLRPGINAYLYSAGPFPLRAAPTTSAEQVAELSPGRGVSILEGPTCQEGYTWWHVRTPNDLLGWINEHGESGFLRPFVLEPVY